MDGWMKRELDGWTKKYYGWMNEKMIVDRWGIEEKK
jgi:hypothetical protein